MKKIILLLALGLSSICLHAQNRYKHFSEQKITLIEGNKVITSLNVMENHELFWNNINQFLGNPEDNLINKKEWKNVAIEGIGNNLTIKIADAVLINDLNNKSACERTFTTEESKKAVLSEIGKGDNFRTMKIYVLSANGENLLNDTEKQKIAADYFGKIFES